VIARGIKKNAGIMSGIENEHRELTVAGWGYRTNDRGWVLYRHPRTGRWHTRTEATAIIENRVISSVDKTLRFRELDSARHV